MKNLKFLTESELLTLAKIINPNKDWKIVIIDTITSIVISTDDREFVMVDYKTNDIYRRSVDNKIKTDNIVLTETQIINLEKYLTYLLNVIKNETIFLYTLLFEEENLTQTNSGISLFDISVVDFKPVITVYTSRPGILIGKGGRFFDKCQDYINKNLKEDVTISLKEIKPFKIDYDYINAEYKI